MAVCSFANQSRRYDSAHAGSYTGGPFKGILHTTEGATLPPYAGGAEAPHFTVLPNQRTKTVTVYQHYDTARPARALLNPAGGVQTNNDSAVQIELVGTCDPRYKDGSRGIYWPEAPTWALDGLAKVMRWIEKEHAVPRRSTPRPWLAYPNSYGTKNGQRMSGPEWDAFAGWAGHQHVAENDHGDPGNLPIGYLLAADPVTIKTSVVKVGSTLAAVAAALGLSLAALVGANPGLPSDPSATVTPGTTITVPAAPTPAPAPAPAPATPAPAPAKPAPSVPSTTTVVRPVLRVGSTGAHVRTLQRALGITADGSFGPKTDAAVRAFQRAHRLVADGIVGARTWAVLGGSPAPAPASASSPRITISNPVVRIGSTGAHVRTVQRAVGARIDGAFGPATDRAVRAFQRAHGLTADGVVGPRTWSVIL